MRKVIIGLSIVAVSLMAVDYSSMTTEQLTALRGTVPVADRDAFRSEMQKRVQTMTPEQLATFRASRSQAVGLRDGSGLGRTNARATGQGINQRLQDGSGAGSMNQGANNRSSQGIGQRLQDSSGAGSMSQGARGRR